MRVVIPQIAWHARDPVLTLDFDPSVKPEEGFYRIVTGGADKLLLIWHLKSPNTIKPELLCVSELTRHQKGINVCRFSPCGNYIAAGDDDAYVYIWKNESKSDKEEVWNVEKIFRRHVEDVSDLCWSADSNFLVSGSIDNTSVLWDVKKGTSLHFWSEREHTGFVQGVAYDPLGDFCATMCIDRNLRFFNTKTGKLAHRALKYPPAWLGTLLDEENKDKDSGKPTVNGQADSDKDKLPTLPTEGKALSEINGNQVENKPVPKKPMTTLNRLFHDDTLKTFCRRLSFSPRGEFLIVPGGLLPPVEKSKPASRQSTPAPANTEEDENSKDSKTATRKFDPEQNNAVIIFCRNTWTNPCAVVPTGSSYSIAARFNPIYYERERKQFQYDADFVNSGKKGERMMSCVGKLRVPSKEEGILLDMPYRLVYAVATNDNIIIGDTASNKPLAAVKNLHCARMTDITWSPDGLVLVASSTDGYCSIITFEKSELGEEFKLEDGAEWPALTPTCFPIAPPEPKPPAKKKEPKEKVVKEKEKEPTSDEKTEKEQAQTKGKKEKQKPPATPVQLIEVKKKPTTLMKMLSKPGSSPAGSSTSQLKQDTTKSSTALLPSTSSSSKASTPRKESQSPPPVSAIPAPTQTTPKPTFLDAWIKKTPVSNKDPKTPVSSKDQKKQPRRIPLITLDTTDAKPTTSANKDTDSVTQNGSSVVSSIANQATPTNSTKPSPTSSATSSPLSQPLAKKPRRIQPIPVSKGSPQPYAQKIVQVLENASPARPNQTNTSPAATNSSAVIKSSPKGDDKN